ncbi:hypothetical protein RSAG8_06125, partial [Rhizoctonia solani AG-8 WAC10335]
MHDPDLPIQLAKHLFDVQMAVYRSQYSFSLFPGDIVYTPPPLPSHIPVILQPVVGAPSDEELKLVHDMVRAAENLANSPSMFDPDISLKLSQHLFNINIARYIRDSMHGQLGSQVNVPQSEQNSSTHATPMAQPIPVIHNNDNQSYSLPSATPNPNPSNPARSRTLASSPEELSTQTKELILRDVMIEVKTAQEETNRLLGEAGETLKNLYTLVSTQLTHYVTQSYNGREVYFRANDRGELPTDSGLNSIDILKLDTLSGQTIARYLRFYSIGVDLIEDGEELKIKPGVRGSAQKTLRNYVIGI